MIIGCALSPEKGVWPWGRPLPTSKSNSQGGTQWRPVGHHYGQSWDGGYYTLVLMVDGALGRIHSKDTGLSLRPDLRVLACFSSYLVKFLPKGLHTNFTFSHWAVAYLTIKWIIELDIWLLIGDALKSLGTCSKALIISYFSPRL